MNDSELFTVMEQVFANGSRKLTSPLRPALRNLKLCRGPDTAARSASMTSLLLVTRSRPWGALKTSHTHVRLWAKESSRLHRSRTKRSGLLCDTRINLYFKRSCHDGQRISLRRPSITQRRTAEAKANTPRDEAPSDEQYSSCQKPSISAWTNGASRSSISRIIIMNYIFALNVYPAARRTQRAASRGVSGTCNHSAKPDPGAQNFGNHFRSSLSVL